MKTLLGFPILGGEYNQEFVGLVQIGDRHLLPHTRTENDAIYEGRPFV